jgi:hypothetical protein
MRGRYLIQTDQLGVRIPIELKRAAQEIAERRGEKLSDLVRRALEEELARLRNGTVKRQQGKRERKRL